MTFYVTIKERIAVLTSIDNGDVGVGGSNQDRVQFTFLDSEFSSKTDKTALFVWAGKYYPVGFSGTSCYIPEIRNANSVKVGVYIGDGDDEYKIASTSVELPYTHSIRDYANEAHDGTGENYTELARGYAETAKQSAKTAKQYAESVQQLGPELDEKTEAALIIIDAKVIAAKRDIDTAAGEATAVAEDLKWALDALDELVGGR